MDEAIEATATVLVDVVVERDPEGWKPGPLELTYKAPSGHHVVTSTAARSTYFHARASATLYGEVGHEARWHRDVDDGASLGGRPVLAVELIRIPTFAAPERGYLIVHVDLGADPVASLAGLRRPPADAIDLLGGGYATAPAHPGRAVIVSYVRFADGVPDGPYGDGYEAWDDSEQWLRVLASATPPSEFEPDPQLDRQPMVALSRSWRAMPLRDGVAFVALRPSTGDPFLASPQPATYVRTIYTDAVLLGLMQKLTLHDIAQRLSNRDSSTQRSSSLRAIEVQLDTFRTTLWWQNVTNHGPANDVLVAFQRQHGLPQMLDQVISDLTDSARLYGLIEGERTSDSLNAITAIGLPAGVVLAMTPIWVEHGVRTAMIAMAVAILLALTALTVLRRVARSRRP